MGCVRKRAMALRDRVGRDGRTTGAATAGGRSNNMTRSRRLNFDGSNSSSASFCIFRVLFFLVQGGNFDLTNFHFKIKISPEIERIKKSDGHSRSIPTDTMDYKG